MQVNKRKNETNSSLLYRFTRKTRQGGLKKETRNRRFTTRPVSKRNRRISAIHRDEKKQDFKRKRKLGLL